MVSACRHLRRQSQAGWEAGVDIDGGQGTGQSAACREYSSLGDRSSVLCNEFCEKRFGTDYFLLVTMVVIKNNWTLPIGMLEQSRSAVASLV